MENLETIKARIIQAARKAGREPETIRLIAVTKGQPIEKIKMAHRAGLTCFGENYAQELVEKTRALIDKEIQWHFLGHLQKNKIHKILGLITWLHSLDSFELAQTIDKKALHSLNCLLEIQFASDPKKTGLSPKEALELIPKLKRVSKIEIKGLMTIPPLSQNPQDSRVVFRQLFQLLKEINERSLYHKDLTELSMGMSDDFEMAIEEGATMIRIGRALFGKRRETT